MNSHDNVFQLNNPSDESYCGLFLSKSSISKFMSNKSIIDDDLMAFIVMLLNGDVADHLLHKDSTVTHNACFGYPNNDDELNPHQKFQFQDDFKIMKKTATVETYEKECSKLRKDCIAEKWQYIYSKMRYDRK